MEDTIISGRVVNPEGVVVADVYGDTLALRALSDTTILALYGNVFEAQEQVQQAFSAVRTEIEMRMAERDATLIIGEGWQAKREIMRSYSYAPDLAANLLGMAESDPAIRPMVNKAVQEVPATYRLNKTHLNTLAKVGGAVKALIEGATTCIESARVKVERRANIEKER